MTRTKKIGTRPQRTSDNKRTFELLQKKDILSSCACHKTRMAMRSVTRSYDDAMRPVGLRATQFLVLVAVASGPAISITVLANVLGMDRSTLTRNIEPLESGGLIQKGNEGWRRSRSLRVTAAGNALISKAKPLWEGAQESLRTKLGEKDWASVHAGLDRLISVASAVHPDR